jgi:hypothetical protein
MDSFEAKLIRLFDAQVFFREPRLTAVIAGESAELSDDDLEYVAAAGDPCLSMKPEEPDGGG